MLLIDLDRFKSVNDSLGHVAGDHLLRQVSSRFDPIISDTMTVGRLGGDEFALVIPDASDLASVERLCLDIIEALKEIGRASCVERVCQYVSITVSAE